MTNKQTDRQTDRQTHRTTTVTLAAHARRGLIIDFHSFANTNKHETLHLYRFYSGNMHNIVIFSSTLLLVLLIVISPSTYIIIEIKTKTNMKICIYRVVVCATCCNIFVNSLLLVLLMIINPSNTLQCRPLSALDIQRPW